MNVISESESELYLNPNLNYIWLLLLSVRHDMNFISESESELYLNLNLNYI